MGDHDDESWVWSSKFSYRNHLQPTTSYQSCCLVCPQRPTFVCGSCISIFYFGLFFFSSSLVPSPTWIFSVHIVLVDEFRAICIDSMDK